MTIGNCNSCVSVDISTVCPPPCPPSGCTPYDYTCGDWTVTTDEKGCTTRTRTSQNLVTGTYTNATVTVANGCVTHVSNGSQVLQQRPEPCTVIGGTPAPTPTVEVSPSPCNLISATLLGIYAGVSFNQVGQNISVTGCGTPSSPLVLSTTLDTGVTSVSSSSLTVVTVPGGIVSVDSVGATYDKCGTKITSGIVKTYAPGPATITGVKGVKGTLDTVTCTETLEFDWSTAEIPSRVITGVTCGNAFVDPAIGSPPALGAWDSVFLTVYGSRLHVRSTYAVTIYDSLGNTVGTGDGIITYGTPELAYAALVTAYTFAGTGAC